MSQLNHLHLCTLNTKGLGDKNKRLRLYEWIKEQKVKIIFLQETHFDNKLIENIKQETKREIFSSNGTSTSRGVAILLDCELDYKMINTCKDNDGRLIMINIEIENIIYTLVNVYAPNKETI